MELKGRVVELLLNEFGFTPKDLEKVKAVLNNIEVKTVGNTTTIQVRMNKITVVMENNKDVY
jgi:hypothetical protein